MMRRISTPNNMRWVPIFLAVLLAFAAGCASTPEPTEEAGEQVDSEFDDASSQTPDTGDVADSNVANRSFNIAPVYFDFDRSEIRSEFGDVLGAGATALKDSGATVVIAGHTDERGSDDYNIALGERRAGAVRKYLYSSDGSDDHRQLRRSTARCERHGRNGLAAEPTSRIPGSLTYAVDSADGMDRF